VTLSGKPRQSIFSGLGKISRFESFEHLACNGVIVKVRDFSSDLTIQGKIDDRISPQVSIILPTYARGRTSLPKAIESVLSQSFGDFEFIIVDDGSRDGTADVLADYARIDSRIFIHTYKRNSGLPALRVNQAALRARGRYIAYQFDDDRWTDDSLQMRVSELEKIDQPAVVYGNSQVDFDATNGRAVSQILGQPFSFALLANQNFIANNTIMHHRKLFDLAGMYDPHIIFRRYSDYDLWLRFSKYAKFLWIDQTISHVTANLVDSLGKEIRHFYTLHRKAISLNRDRLLRPDAIEDYDVVDIAQLGARLTDDEIENYRRNIAVPFLANFSDHCVADELDVAASIRSRPLNLLTVKPDYSTSVDVTINNFANLPFQRSLTNTFVPERDLAAFDLKGTDVAILYRTVGEATSILASRSKVPTVYVMDDNMLHFHEVGPEHHLLAPETAAHRNIVRQISTADACIGYSDVITEDLRDLNRKTIQLATNIPRKFVQPREYKRGERLRVAILSGSVRAGILAELWPALTDFSKRYANEVELHFWGIDPAAYGPLACAVYFKSFNYHYEGYLNSLLEASFDVVLVPLDHSTRAAKSKSPIKLLEAVAVGAMCIFTDAPPYASRPDDCCLKAPNTIAAWSAALEDALAMGPTGRTALLERARSLVVERYETETQFYDFLAAYDAVKLHARLGDGAIAFGFHEAALGGATLHLLHHARMARSLGFDVVGIVPAGGPHLESFRDRWNESTLQALLVVADWPGGYVSATEPGLFLQRPASEVDAVAVEKIIAELKGTNIGLLHFATWSPAMIHLGEQLNVPSVASVHQFYDGAESSVVGFADAIHCSSLTHGIKWEQAARRPVRRIICPADDSLFASFRANRERVAQSTAPLRILVSGTLQPRKNQLAVIEALGELKRGGCELFADLIGYTEFDAQYVSDCRMAIERNGLNENVKLHGFVENPPAFYDRADLLLVAAFDESMPQTIIQAMASGVPVISTNVGGVKEIVRHRYTGLLTQGASPNEVASTILEWLGLSINQRLEIVDRAHRTARLARPSYVKFELISLYNEAARRNSDRRQESRQHVGATSAVSSSLEDASIKHLVKAVLGKWAPGKEKSAEISSIRKFAKRHFQRVFRDKIVLCEDLRLAPYREYVIPFEVERLSEISLVMGAVNPSTVGEIGIEIVKRSQEIAAHELFALEPSSERVAVRFALAAPIVELEEGWRLRIFVRNVDVAVSICEFEGRSERFGGELRRVPLVRFD
jgi:glycosyltransferase involved in cell wall biosynthesis